MIVIISFILSPLYFAGTSSEAPYSDDEISAFLRAEESVYDGTSGEFSTGGKLGHFDSYDDMDRFLEYNRNLSLSQYSNSGMVHYGFDSSAGSPQMMMSGSASGMAGMAGGPVAGGFSTTNIQVSGVDEGDTVKNDNEYAYILQSNKVLIVDAFPPEDMHKVSSVFLNFSAMEIYVNFDMLVIVGHQSGYGTQVVVYDIKDRANPILSREEMLVGSLLSSRMVDRHLYLITSYTNMYGRVNESTFPVPIDEVYYVNEYDYSYSLTLIHSMNFTSAGEPVTRKVILSGRTGNVYASVGNIYLTCSRRMNGVSVEELKCKLVYSRTLPERERERVADIIDSEGARWDKMLRVRAVVNGYLANCTPMQNRMHRQSMEAIQADIQNTLRLRYEKTIIHRISIDGGEIEVMASGSVGGTLLNRFSMDEYDGHFRIATTTGQVSRSGQSTACNHLFIMDMSLNVTGSIEDIAPGEKIYSARFVGKMGYIVTFKKVDPLFVIDLSDPAKPEIAGELKIPGYSNYLHPVGENHVLGIGKDSVDMGDFAWYQGVKVSLFDVSDMDKPREVNSMVIGDRGTESIALSDPHALLFSLERGFFVIPIQLAEIDQSLYPNPPPETVGTQVWSGAYVFTFDLEDGIQQKGTIEHSRDQESQHSYYYHYAITRTFYMDDHLYSVSYDKMMAHSLDTLAEEGDLDI